MIAVFASFYSQNLSSDTKRAKRARAMRGEYNGSIPPFGYRFVRVPREQTGSAMRRGKSHDMRRLQIDPVLGPIVRQMFERYATGRYSDPQTAHWLNQQPAVRASRKGSKPIGKDSVRDIMKNRLYAGYVSYAETIYQGGFRTGRKSSRNRKMWFNGLHEPLISDELWQVCQAVRETMRKRRKSKSQRRVYLMPDRVYCVHCLTSHQVPADDRYFGKMRVAWNKRQKLGQYICVARERGYEVCQQSRTKEPDTIAQVVAALKQVELKADPEQLIDDLVRSRPDNEETLEKIAFLEQRRERIQHSWEIGRLKREDYEQKIEDIDTEIATSRPLDYDKLHEAYDLLANFHIYWEACEEVEEPREARQQLLSKVIDRVFVYNQDVIAVALHTDFGAVLNMPHAAPAQILQFAREAGEEKEKSASSKECTQCGSDGFDSVGRHSRNTLHLVAA